MRTQVLRPTWKFMRIASIVVLILARTAYTSGAESATSTNDVTNATSVVRTYGTEGGYRTEVTSQSKGTLSQEDRRQVAVLTAQVFQHINEAQRALDADNAVEARNELDMGRKAIKAVRSMLPSTIVHTKTTAPDGGVVYEDKRELQEHRVPLFEGMLSTKTLAPIVAAKEDAQDAVEVKGVRLIGSETITTEAFADLEYVERQLERAANALNENQADTATKALALAQVRGVEFRYHKDDSPLAAARDALWLAKRALDEKNATQAQTNLNTARQQLEIYRQLLPEGQRHDVTQMMTEVSQLDAKLRQETSQPENPAASKSNEPERTRQGNDVTRWWEQVNGWFKKRS